MSDDRPLKILMTPDEASRVLAALDGPSVTDPIVAKVYSRVKAAITARRRATSRRGIGGEP